MKKFRSIKQAEKFIESNGWCECYLHINRFYLVFKTLEKYKEHSIKNL